MSGSASITNTFAARSAPIPLSQLDANFTDLQSYANDPTNRANYATDTGTTNTVLLSFTPPVLGYTAGLAVSFKAINANSGSVAINVNALGAKGFLNPDQSALQAGQFIVGGVYNAMYDGTQFILQTGYAVPASAAQMQTATSAITFAAPSTIVNSPYAAKVLALFPGTVTGTVSSLYSKGVSSVIRNSAGNYTINFSSPFATTSYVTIMEGTSITSCVVLNSIVRFTSSCVIAFAGSLAGTAADANAVNFVAYGDT